VFSYYGSKSKIARRYPFPQFGKIVEPFAGAAAYSLLYYDRQVTLVDKSPVIAGIWKWILRVTPEEAMALPEPDVGDDIRKMEGCRNLCQEAKWFLGFVVHKGNSSPCNISTERNGLRPKYPRFMKEKLAWLAPRIRHWRVIEGSYCAVKNQEATWFVDPPYTVGGDGYPYHDVDYEHLGRWCQSREGQVIVCERDGADWLPFEPFVVQRGLSSGTRKRADKNVFQEMIYHRGREKADGQAVHS